MIKIDINTTINVNIDNVEDFIKQIEKRFKEAKITVDDKDDGLTQLTVHYVYAESDADLFFAGCLLGSLVAYFKA